MVDTPDAGVALAIVDFHTTLVLNFQRDQRLEFMTVDLTKLPLNELLDKFGAGGHKPGSGSAAALLGMLSCKLIRTVISLTPDKVDYKAAASRLAEINSEITTEIEPALLSAFETDAKYFDQVIEARNRRDNEKDQGQRWLEARKALAELKSATDLPLAVAQRCLDLAQHAITVFDIGFKSARGDSEVAADSALSAATGALSIVYLNLKSFQGGPWEKATLEEAKALERRAGELRTELLRRIAQLRADADDANARFNIKLLKLRDPALVGQRVPEDQIERIAENLQKELWRNRTEIWRSDVPASRVDVLRPDVAFNIIGYKLETVDSLGQASTDGGLLEVAGYIDEAEKFAAVSAKFSMEVRNFTAAHELGHALLHKALGLHRDRPLDGSVANVRRDRVEIEADKFAVYFLMPRREVTEVFAEIFGTQRFTITDASAFALMGGSTTVLRDKCGGLRGLSRLLVNARQYAGNDVVSLVERFGVSTETMAIRLQELELLEF